METAQPIARRHQLELRPLNDLGEIRTGEWEGMALSDLDALHDWRRFNAFRSGVRPPGGELMLEMQTRMIRQLDALASQHPGECVALVSHADPIRAVLSYYLGAPLDLLLRMEISPASVSVVELGEWSPRILCLNETGDIAV